MANFYFNGLHWVSPVDNAPMHNPRAQQVYNAGQGFNGAFIIADEAIDTGGNPNNWRDAIDWVYHSAKRSSEIVLRLQMNVANPPNPCTLGDGVTLGKKFYRKIVKPAIQLYNIRQFSVLNELNVDFQSCGDPLQIAGIMYNIAYHIKAQAAADQLLPVFLGFPSIGGFENNPLGNVQAWDDYWSAYSGTITAFITPVQDRAYNWLSVHMEGEARGPDSLTLLLQATYDDLNRKFPGLPHRYTEYGIPLSFYGQGLDPESESPETTTRIEDMATALLRFRNYVRNANGVDVYAMHAYISGRSDEGALGSIYNIAPKRAPTLANVF